MESTALIGSSIVIRGEMLAQEDVTIAGRIEGTLRIDGHCVTVGAGAEILADIHAREIIVSGQVVGSLSADRIVLRESADIEGNLAAPALQVADGAGIRGRVEMPAPERAADAA